MSLCPGNKLRLLHPGVLEHHCAGGCGVHEIDIHAQSHNGHVIGWDGDTHKPTFAESIRHYTEHGTCEYVLRGGVQYFTENCWHELRGKARHLEEFPR